jgi:cytochrome c biogenesis protein CcdA
MIFPEIWEKFALKLKLGSKSGEALAKSTQKSGIKGEILIGASLGPVFASCSPTYLYIVSTVFLQSFQVGLLNLIVYTLGLMLILLLVAFFGQKLTQNLKILADPRGVFKRSLGVVFLLIGLAIMFSLDKKIEAYLVQQGFGVTSVERDLLDQTTKQ